MHTLMDPPQSQPFVPPEADEGRALYIRGLLALRNGDAEEAASLLTQALRRQPTHRGMRRNLVRALLAAERFEQVLHQANAALAGTPDDAELHFARGTALNALGQHARACAAFARALSLRPDHAPSWLNMGNASADLDDLASAEALYRTAIRLDAALPEAHASLGYILTMQGRLAEAIEACETAIRLRPDFAQAHWNLAIAALLSGDLPRGFAEYEWRKRHARYRVDFPDLPGRPVGWRRCRRPNDPGARGARIWRCDPVRPLSAADPRQGRSSRSGLRPLAGAADRVHARGSRGFRVGRCRPLTIRGSTRSACLGSFGTTLDTIPSANAYLFADPIRTRAWRARLFDKGNVGGRKVGIAFAGNPRHRADRRRSIPADLAVTLP